jgi:AraC-like DNA-binding protein
MSWTGTETKSVRSNFISRLCPPRAAAVAGPGIGGVARDFAVSPRTLQRLFARHVGATPKQVLQRFRRRRAVDRLSEPGRPSLARIAAEPGYADQSHLTATSAR